MKIVLLATVYEVGGLSNVIRNIIDYLDKKKFEIVLIVENLAERHYPLRTDIEFINLEVKPARGIAGKFINVLRHLYRIRRTIMNEAPDTVVGFGFAVNCLYLLSFLWPAKKMPRVILGEYTEELFIKESRRSFKYTIFSFIYKAIIFLLYARADAIVSVSESLARHLKKFFLIDNKKIKVIYVPVNSKEILMQSRKEICEDGHKNNLPCVGTLSRLSFEKGINFLLEAFSDLLKSIDARLIIIGEGKEEKGLKKMARDLKIEDKVTFLGWLKNPYNYLRKIDVFVLASLWEGFPTVVVESMLCEVPVVATRSVGGVQELIEDGMNGLLVPLNDRKALSGSIYRLLKNKELRERLAKEAAKRVEEFDSYNITRQYESLILSL